jgi:predicted kinase
VRDPFGHIWILRQRLEALSVGDIQKQRDELFARFAGELPAAPSASPIAPATTRAENAETLRISPATAQARNDAVPQIHLVIGPVGAGKSTFALRLAREHTAIRLTLDEWMTELFSADRPDTAVIDWYMERAARCIEQIWRTARALIAADVHVVLELGLLRRAEREHFYERVNGAGSRLAIHVLDADRDIRRERVTERNHNKGATFSMIVPPAVFEFASDLWEPLTPSECDGRDVRFIRTDGALESARR